MSSRFAELPMDPPKAASRFSSLSVEPPKVSPSEMPGILREYWGVLSPPPVAPDPMAGPVNVQQAIASPEGQALARMYPAMPQDSTTIPETTRILSDGSSVKEDYRMYSLGDDLKQALPEVPKGFARGYEQANAAVGSGVEGVGDWLDAQGRMWKRLYYESPIGQKVLERRRERYIAEHGSLPEPSITAAPETLGGKVSDAGQDIYEFWQEAVNTGWERRNPEVYAGTLRENPSITRIVGGASESAPTMLSALALSAAGAPGMGLTLLTASEALPTYTEAKRMGASEGDAFSYALLSGIGTAALERVGINSILGKSPAVNALVEKMGQKWVAGALVNFAVEGTQEAAQEMWQNAVAMGYDGDRELFDNALESGITGGILGGGSSIGVSIMNDYMQRQADNSKGLTPEQIDAAVRDNMRPENAQIKLERVGPDVSDPVVGGDVAAPKGTVVEVDVSGQGPMNPALQARVLDLADQEQPLPPEGRGGDGPPDPEVPVDRVGALDPNLVRVRNVGIAASVKLVPVNSDPFVGDRGIQNETDVVETDDLRLVDGVEYRKLKGAANAPVGMAWFGNGKSRFNKDGGYRQVLLPDRLGEKARTAKNAEDQPASNVRNNQPEPSVKSEDAAPPAGVKDENASTPAEAATEVRDEMANPDNPRPAGEIKKDIVAQLEVALENAPARDEYDFGAADPDMVTFSIPGDGTFTINNYRENVEKLLKRAKQLGTKNLPVDRAAEGANAVKAGGGKAARGGIVGALVAFPDQIPAYEKQVRNGIYTESDIKVIEAAIAEARELLEQSGGEPVADIRKFKGNMEKVAEEARVKAAEAARELRYFEGLAALRAHPLYRELYAAVEVNEASPKVVPEDGNLLEYDANGKGMRAVTDLQKRIAADLGIQKVPNTSKTWSAWKWSRGPRPGYNLDQYSAYRSKSGAGSSGSRAETAGAAKGGDASGGLGAAGVPVDDPLYTNLPIEMPELVEFAELLGRGKLPKIREHLGRAIGLFRYERGNPEAGGIELRADIFNLIHVEDRLRLRREALDYARRVKELDPSVDETKVFRDRYNHLYDQLLEERKQQDPVLARKTLAHEIGHWVDFLPEGLISRGNILGHIAALKGYTKTLLAEKPGAEGPLTAAERAVLRRRAEKELKAMRGEVREIVEEIVREEPVYKDYPVTPADIKSLMGLDARDATPELYEWFARQDRAVKKEILKAAMQGLVDERASRFGRREQVGTKTTRETVRRTVGGEPVTKEQIRERYRELLKEEVSRRRLHELEVIKAELEAAIAWWNGTDKMPEYYRKPEEMFADAYSIFINNPQSLAKRAPGFFKAMMDYMDARPEVRRIYDQLQEDIRNGVIYRNRVDRLHKAFVEGDAAMFDRQNAGRQATATERLDAVRFSVDAVFGPMEARVRRSGVSADKAGEIGAAVENYLYRASGHEYYMGRMHQEVVRPLLDAGLQWSDLSELMFHNRVINERHSMANPLGWTPKSSRERLDEMQARLGPQRWAVLDQARKNLWSLNGVVRDMVREAGLFTSDLMDRIDENLHYAAFAVKRDGSVGDPGSIEEMLENSYGSNTGPKIYRQLGTLKKVQDPAAATAMKMLSLMDSARRNVAKSELVDLLRNEFPNEIKRADLRWNGRYREIVVRESDRAGTVVVMRNGSPEGWYVPKVFVEAFERGNTVENRVLMKTLSAPSRAVKNLYTQLNYGFWPVAFVRDVMAFKVKMPRVSNVPFGGPQFWRHFRRALVDSWSSVMGAPNAGALESLSKQDWITVANPMASRGDGEAIDKLMQRYWQDPAHLNSDRPAIAAAVKAWTKWMELGQVFERTVKRAGRIYLDRNFDDMPEWRKQYIVHNYSGSPNFLRKGALNPVLDFAALFYNPWKESIRSSFKRFQESPATMAWNASKYAVAPKVMMWLFASGAMTVVLKELFGDDGEEFGREVEMMYRYVPEYDKSNYTIVPLGWDDREQNKVAYLRLPLAEEMRIPSALTWKLLNRSGDVQQSLNYMGGQLPVGNPMWEVPLAWGQYLSGRNPYDWFRGQPMLDDNVAEARDWRGVAAMGKYTWNAFGGSIIHRFDLRDYVDDKTSLERFLDLPVISNALGRWVKVSNRGLADTLREKVSVPYRRDRARAVLDAQAALLMGDFSNITNNSVAIDYLFNNVNDRLLRQSLRPEDAMIQFAPTTAESMLLQVELQKLMGTSSNAPNVKRLMGVE